MSRLARRVPRSDLRSREIGRDVPVWQALAQLYLVIFMFLGFDTVPLNPKPHFALDMMLIAATVVFTPRGTMSRVYLSVPVVLFVTWWLISFTWAPRHGLWANATMSQLEPILGLVIIGSLLPVQTLLRTLLGCVYGMITYTLLYTVAFPGKSTALNNAGTGELVNVGWHGPFIHKNSMASYMVFGLVLVLSFEDNSRRRRAASIAMIGLVLLSRSGTGAGALITAMASLFWCRRYAAARGRTAGTLVVVSFLTSVLALTVVFSFLPAIIGVYGKDLTFSGRTDIWKASLSAVRGKPWTGYGWGGVWIDPTTEPTFSIIRKLGYIVFHAHNGAIELMIETGVVGLALYLAVLLSTARGGWQIFRTDAKLAQVVVTYCILVTVSSVSEVLVLGPWLALLVFMRTLALRSTHQTDGRTTRLGRPGSPASIAASAVAETGGR